MSELEIIGGDKRKVGYYVGLIASWIWHNPSHFTDYLLLQESFNRASLLLTTFQWNRISDRIGRKPVMLVGVFGLTVSMITFGLSRAFWSLVARSLSSLEPVWVLFILNHHVVDASGGCWMQIKVCLSHTTRSSRSPTCSGYRDWEEHCR